MKLGQLLLKEPLKEACQRKQWWGRKKEEWTLTRNPATLFFVVSASSRSVNYRDTQHSLPRASPPKPQSLLLALSEKTLSLQNFQPLFTLSLFSSLFHSNPRGTESFLFSYRESYKKGKVGFCIRVGRERECQLCYDMCFSYSSLCRSYWAVILPILILRRAWSVKRAELCSRLWVIWSHWLAAFLWRGRE